MYMYICMQPYVCTISTKKKDNKYLNKKVGIACSKRKKKKKKKKKKKGMECKEKM